MGSETDFSKRAAETGSGAWFVADAVVAHIIRPHQLQREWIVQRAFRLGRHMCLFESDQIPRDAPRWRGAPRWKYRELLEHKLTRMSAIVRGDFDARFRAEWNIQYLNGYLQEAARLQRLPTQTPAGPARET